MDGKDTPAPGDDEEIPDTPEADDPESPDPDEGDSNSDEGTSEEDLGPDDATGDDDPEVTPGPDEADEGLSTKGKGRAAQRVSRLANEAKTLREKDSAREAELLRLRTQLTEVQRHIQGSTQNRDAEAERALLEQMDPIQRVQYEADKKIANLQGEIRNVQLTALDGQDRAAFAAKATLDPVRNKYAAKVEDALSSMRAKGMNAPREDIYYYLLGKSFAEAKRNSGKNPDKKEAQARVDATRSRPAGGARSDASSSRRAKTAEDRLGDTPI